MTNAAQSRAALGRRAATAPVEADLAPEHDEVLDEADLLDESVALADDDAGLDEPVDTDAAGSDERAGRSRLAAVLAVTTALATVAAAVLGVLLWQEQQRGAAHEEALTAARDFATDLTSYNFETLDADFQKVLDGSTEPFKSQYADTTENLTQLFTEFQATSTSTVLDAGVAEVDGDSASVVLFVDQTVQNTNSAEPRVDRNRVRLDLQQVDGKWLVSEVTVT